MANVTTEQQVRDFTARQEERSILPDRAWLDKDPSLRLYVRANRRRFYERTIRVLDIAQVEAHPTGTGRFGRLLDYLEELKPLGGVFIENVVEDRFREYLIRRGYTQVNWTIPPSVYRLWE